MKVTFLKDFHYRPKLSRKDAWQSTVIRYKAGVECDASEAVIAAAIEAGALPAPEVVEAAAEPQPDDVEGE